MCTFQNLRKKQSDPKRMQIHTVLTPILSEFQERPKKTCIFQNMFFHMETLERPVKIRKRVKE